MIKKYIPSQQNHKYTQSITHSKPTTMNQNNIKKKLSYAQVCHHNNQTTNNNHKINTSKPLKQITNSFNNKPHQNLQQFQKQKPLKSQSSLNDLSQIVAIEMLSAQKKQTPLKITQNYQKYNKQSNMNKINLFHKKDKIPLQFEQDINDKSIHFDDFQILDVYATTAIKTQQQQIQKSKTFKENRKLGGIRRNSRTIINDQQSIQKIKQHQITKIKSQSNSFDQNQKSPFTSIDSSKNISRRPSIDIQQLLNQDIIKCGQKLFYELTDRSTVLIQKHLQKSSLNCQIKLILGPILTKLKQKKYTQLNLSTFKKQFNLIMKDFSVKERLDIIQKIQQNKYFANKYDNQMQQDIIYCNSFRQKQQQNNKLVKQQQKYLSKSMLFEQVHKQIPIQTDQTQVRLQVMTSKVDTLLNKINSKYRLDEQQIRRQMQSTLMSRLSQIEQLSGDSQQLMNQQYQQNNKNIYYNNNKQQQQTQLINKYVYVQKTQRNLDEEAYQYENQYQNNYKYDKYNNRDYHGDKLNRNQINYQSLNKQNNYYSNNCSNVNKQYIKKYENIGKIYSSLQSPSCLPFESYESTLLNKKDMSFQSASRLIQQRQICRSRFYNKLFPQTQQQPTLLSFRNIINLQFNQLSKYIN